MNPCNFTITSSSMAIPRGGVGKGSLDGIHGSHFIRVGLEQGVA